MEGDKTELCVRMGWWCGGAAQPPLGHIAMSGLANMMFLCSELGQSGTLLPWLWYGELGQSGTP